MGTNNLKVDLDPREDKEKQIYYLGRLQFPGRIDFSHGVTFLVFLSEDGAEEVQVAINNKENTTFSKYTRRNDRVKVSIDSREDQFGKTFYVAKLQFNGYIECEDEVVFLIFNSKEGSEELQMVGNIKFNSKDLSTEPEIYPGRLKMVDID